EILPERRREEVEGDRWAGREVVGNLDVEQQEKQDDGAGWEDRREPRQTRSEFVVSCEQCSTTDEQRRGADQIRIEIPVPDADSTTRLVVQHLGVERQPNEYDGKQADREEEQSFVWNAAIEPGESSALQRPTDRDPVALELERNCQRHEA